MRYFLTGHTGFKGSWLTILLTELGHEVVGYSRDVPSGGLFEKANIERVMQKHMVADVRDLDSLRQAVIDAKPDIAIHLAAQSLVIPSYESPIETFSTNVEGTLNFLQTVSESDEIRASLVVTSDKVYRNTGRGNHVESDPLGGNDPYSASKAMADILTQSWAASGFSDRVYVARAGNVIGAFDVSRYRLMADIARVVESGKILTVRNPGHVRPWQHVLDCLSGYLQFTEAAVFGTATPRVLNFGPPPSSVRSVLDVVGVISGSLPRGFEVLEDIPGRETSLLTLDSQLAQDALGWKNLLDFETAVAMSIPDRESLDASNFARNQVRSYLER